MLANKAIAARRVLAVLFFYYRVRKETQRTNALPSCESCTSLFFRLDKDEQDNV